MLFPAAGFTRDDAIAYYRTIAKVILPHLRNRPLSFKRYPSTINQEFFWEKDAPSFTPSWVKRASVPRRSGESAIEYVVANDVRTLAWIASVGGVELHPFLHRAPKIDRPTDVVFDLDPGAGATILECCQVALILRDALAAIKLDSFVKVSGSKGLQLYVPLNTAVTHDQTELFARMIAEELARRNPKLIVAKMARNLRARKVFIDWSQNAGYKTTVSVYSLRSKQENPFVSVPMRWAEIARPGKLSFTPAETLQRVKRLGDLWSGAVKLKQTLPVARAHHVRTHRPAPAELGVVVNGIRLPKARSQSGRRLFALTKTGNGNELWLDMHGKFKRWILRSDREGDHRLIALPAGDFEINDEYYRGEVPQRWRPTVKLEDLGAYEVIEGSYQEMRFDLFFTGRVLAGHWILEKLTDDKAHRSWSLEPVA